MLCMLMSGWLDVFPSVRHAATKAKKVIRLRGRRMMKKTMLVRKNSLSAHFWLYSLKKIKCKRFCGDRGDNKGVGADTQTGPSVSINEEGSFHA